MRKPHLRPSTATAIVVLALLIGGFMGDPADADSPNLKLPGPKPIPAKSVDQLAIEGILAKHKSPLPSWTIVAFAQNHPDFDIAGYLTVVWCESSLGTTGGSFKHNNPGNIKYMEGSDKIWHTLATGKWYCKGQGWYNEYPDMYTGQRAVIRLLYDGKSGYNRLLADHEWTRFGRTYYGAGVPGLNQYLKNLKSAHARIVKEAATYGAQW